MSKSNAVINAILFDMYQQEMPNHEFAHLFLLPVDQSNLLWRKNRDNNPANTMFFVLSNYEIFIFCFLCYLIMRFLYFFLNLRRFEIRLKTQPHSV